MKKQVKKVFGKKYYLLGINNEGEKEWLEEGHFDCGWYWGAGYVEVFNKRYTDIKAHTHFDSLFFNKTKNCYDAFKEHYNSIPNYDVWKLLELMKSIYTLREYSDFLYTCGSHITSNPCKDIIENEKEYKRINEVLIPSLLKEVYKILGSDDD